MAGDDIVDAEWEDVPDATSSKILRPEAGEASGPSRSPPGRAKPKMPEDRSVWLEPEFWRQLLAAGGKLVSQTLLLAGAIVFGIFVLTTWLGSGAAKNGEMQPNDGQSPSADLSVPDVIYQVKTSSDKSAAENRDDAPGDAEPGLQEHNASGGDATLKDGATLSGYCLVSIGDNKVMDGPCSGAGHGNSLFISSESDGCSVELTNSSSSVTGTLLAYKDVCWLDKVSGVEVKDELPLGKFEYSGRCWSNDRARICLRPED